MEDMDFGVKNEDPLKVYIISDPAETSPEFFERHMSIEMKEENVDIDDTYMQEMQGEHGTSQYSGNPCSDPDKSQQYDKDMEVTMYPGHKRPKRRSCLWAFFKIVNEAEKIAVCNICHRRISYYSTVTNMKTHLRKKHPTVNLNADGRSGFYPASSGTSMPHSISSATPSVMAAGSTVSTSNTASMSGLTAAPVENQHSEASTSNTITESRSCAQSQTIRYASKNISETQKTNIDCQLLKLFILDFQPFSIVDDCGFVDFVRALNPNYKLPNRKHITTSLLPAVYEQYLNYLKEKLFSVESVCLTIDCWTSKNNESYLAVSAHFISADFELLSVLLECSMISASDSSKNLAEEITTILDKFHLKNKVFIAVTDNAYNIKNAITEYLKFDHFSCYAHTLNFIAQDALKHIKDIQDKVKIVVAHFKGSTLANEKLMSCQKDSGVDPPKKLIQDVVTRWNSTYYMLQRFLELKDSIKVTTPLLNKNLPELTEEEWKICRELCLILKPFEEVTRKLSDQNYISSSEIIILTDGLTAVCKKCWKEIYQ